MNKILMEKSNNIDVFEGGRIFLRPIIINDSDLIVKWRSDKENYKYFYNPKPVTKEEHLNWFERYINDETSISFIILDKTTNTSIGTITLTKLHDHQAEIGYIIGNMDYRHLGYATEAIKLVIDKVCKHYDIWILNAGCNVDNVASINLLKKIGFIQSDGDEVFVNLVYPIYTKPIDHVYFRLDLGPSIGLGHYRRCQTIAHSFKEDFGINYSFILSSDSDESLLITDNEDFVKLQTPHLEMDSELVELFRMLDDYSNNILVLDSYYFSEYYLNNLNDKVFTVLIDDIPRFDYKCPCIINYNIYANMFHYSQIKYKFLGLPYYPLRNEFKDKKIGIKPQIMNIFITSGGSDSMNFIEDLINNCCLVHTQYCYHIVLGSMNQNADKIMLNYSKCDNLMFYKNPKTISEIMLKCDIAISACGSTIYELMSLGIPLIAYSMADNQKYNADSLSKINDFIYAGDIRIDKSVTIKRINKIIDYLASDFEARKSESNCFNNSTYCSSKLANTILVAYVTYHFNGK